MEVVDALNRDGEYPIKIVSNEEIKEVIVNNVSAVNGMDIQKVAGEIASCDIMCTAVGVNILPRIIPNMAEGIRKRYDNGKRELNIIICENLIGADKYIKSLLKDELGEKYDSYIENSVGFVEASVGRMVPVMTEEMKEGNLLKVWVEPFCTLPVDKEAFKGEIPEINGMEPSEPFEYHIQSKLFLHNMGHALTAYLGYANKLEYIWQAIENPFIKDIVSKAMAASALALSKEHGKSHEMVQVYADNLIERFGNKYLGDTVARVGRDIKRKLSSNDRLVGAANLCKKHRIDNKEILTGIALGLCFESDDPGTLEVQKMLSEIGIKEVLKELCGFEEGSDEIKRIVEIYDSLKK
jgi:mannitol-1-phosphate 5-dehydrogenase